MADHDPLCCCSRHLPRFGDSPCETCDLIARARADERERIAQEIEADCDHMSSGVYEDASLNDVCPVCARCAAVARGGESDG